MNKNNIKKIISMIILIFFLFSFINYLIHNYSNFQEISLIAPKFLIFLTFLVLINIYLTGFNNLYILKPLGINFKPKEVFQLGIITRFYNYISPFRGGMLARAYYLKKKYKIEYTNFLATLSGSYVLILILAGTLGLITSLLIYVSKNILNWIILSIFLISIFIALIIIVISPKIPKTNRRWLKKIRAVIKGWELLKNNPKILFIITLSLLIQILVSSFMLNFQFKMFGIPISYIDSLFLTSITSLSFILSLTPANLGVSEAITVFSASAIGIDTVGAIAATLSGRIMHIIILFTLGPIVSYKLIKK
jgi:glycosyltransferase AglD